MADIYGPSGVPDPASPTAGADIYAPGYNPPGPFAKALGAGVAALKGQAYGAGALAAHAAASAGVSGAAGVEQSALAAAQEKNQQAAAGAPPKVEDVDWKSPGAIFDYAKAQIGNAIPALGALVAGGATGKLLGAAASRTALVSDLVAKNAQLAGVAATDFATRAGGEFVTNTEAGVENPGARAAAGGVAATALDLLPYFAADKYLGKAGNGSVGDILKGAAKGTALGAALQGAQQGAQPLISRASAGQDLTSPDAISEYINSAAGGALIGGAFGTGIGAHHGLKGEQPTISPPSSPPVDNRPELDLNGQPIENRPLPPITGPDENGPQTFPEVPGANAPIDVPPPLSTGAESPAPARDLYNRDISDASQDADFEKHDQLATATANLDAQHAEISSRISALDAEINSTAANRRPKATILKERKPLQAQLDQISAARDEAKSQLDAMKQSLRDRFDMKGEPDAIPPKDESPSAPPVDLNPEPGETPLPGVKTPEEVAAEVPPLKTPHELDTIVPSAAPEHDPTTSVALDATKNTLGDLNADFKVPGDLEQKDLDSYSKTSDEALKVTDDPLSEAPGRQALVDAATESIKKNASELAMAGSFRKGTALKARDQIIQAAVEAAKAPTVADAIKQVHDAAIEALKGKMNKADAESFAGAIAKDLSAAPKFFSKGAVSDPNARRILMARFIELTKKNGELAAKHTGLTKDEATQHAANAAEIESIKAQFTGKPLESRAAPLTTEQFHNLPQDIKNTVVDYYDKAMTDRGQGLIRRLNDMLGIDPNREVKLFQAAPGEAVGSYTPPTLGAYKSLISLALNAKDALGVADHEGYHYAEDQLLNGNERQIVTRALQPNTKLFKQVLDAARKYDVENGTRLADEIRSTPEEARAYAFQFWKNGDLQPGSGLAKVWAKIQDFLQKLSNHIQGLGFTSIEDVFTALDRGQYADRTAHPGGIIRAQEVLHSQAAAALSDVDHGKNSIEYINEARAALADLERRVRNGELEREQAQDMTAKLLDQASISHTTGKAAFGAIWDQIAGGVADWHKTWLATPNYIGKFSTGYENVRQVLSALDRWKATAITRNTREVLSRWHDGSMTRADETAVGKALLDRTSRGWAEGSPELATSLARLTDQQREMYKQARQMVDGLLDQEFAVDQATWLKYLPAEEAQQRITDRAAQVEQMKREGYVPERRYGDHTVDVFYDGMDKDGKPQHLTTKLEFFDHSAGAARVAAQYKDIIERNGSKLQVEVGVRHKTARDTSISLQQFLDTARRNGIPLEQAEKERIVRAMTTADSQRRNRMMQRKNVPGYSEDITRVLHEFAVGMVSKLAYDKFAPAIDAATDGNVVNVQTNAGADPTITTDPTRNLWKEDGPKSGFYRNQADELADYNLVPDHTGEWSRKLRGAGMLYFIGGSISQAVTNSMQVPMFTIPYLAQHVDYTHAATTTLGAYKETWANINQIRDINALKNPDIAMSDIDRTPGLRAALVQAAEDGRTMDTEIHQIMGMAQGSQYAQSRAVQKAVSAWMAPFRITEQVNRISTFIAAFRIGAEKGLTTHELYKFAAESVDGTQNTYSPANRPGAARNSVGAMLFMFKSFPLFTLETMHLMYKQNPRAAVMMLAGFAAMSGVQGMPFAGTLEDMVDTIAQRLFNSPFNSRRAMRNIVKDASEAITGADLSSLVLHGVANDMLGMDVANRLGVGNFVPGTRIGAADADYGRELESILGAPYSMVAGTVRAATGPVLKGEFEQAIQQSGPVAIRNLIKGASQFSSGTAVDQKGQKLIDTTGPEALWQSAGFTSNALSKAYENDAIDKQTTAFYTQVRTQMTADIVKAARSGDTEKMQQILDFAASWNKSYPMQPLTFDSQTIRRDIAEAGLPLNERTLLKMPRQLRGSSTALEGSGGQQ